jgi:hypothetical protein
MRSRDQLRKTGLTQGCVLTPGGVGGSSTERLLRQRLSRIAYLARRMVEQARVNPQTPASGLVAELVRIADEAEG